MLSLKVRSKYKRKIARFECVSVHQSSSPRSCHMGTNQTEAVMKCLNVQWAVPVPDIPWNRSDIAANLKSVPQQGGKKKDAARAEQLSDTSAQEQHTTDTDKKYLATVLHRDGHPSPCRCHRKVCSLLMQLGAGPDWIELILTAWLDLTGPVPYIHVSLAKVHHKT